MNAYLFYAKSKLTGSKLYDETGQFGGNEVIWTLVGVLLLVALVIWILNNH